LFETGTTHIKEKEVGERARGNVSHVRTTNDREVSERLWESGWRSIPIVAKFEVGKRGREVRYICIKTGAKSEVGNLEEGDRGE
jgi:hypothetical protein